jgi:hypothetical protein
VGLSICKVSHAFPWNAATPQRGNPQTQTQIQPQPRNPAARTNSAQEQKVPCHPFYPDPARSSRSRRRRRLTISRGLMHLLRRSDGIAFSDSCKIRSLPATPGDRCAGQVGQGNGVESRNIVIFIQGTSYNINRRHPQLGLM